MDIRNEEALMTQVQEKVATQPVKGASPVRIRKLGHIVLQVRDVERSLRFYTEILNFRISDRQPTGGAFLNAVGDHHTVGLFPSDGANAEVPSKGAVRLHHFAMEVASIDELFEIREFLKSRDVPIVFEGRRALGSHTSVEFLDPDGYHLEFYCDMDQIGWDNRSRPRQEKQCHTLELARDNPKSGSR